KVYNKKIYMSYIKEINDCQYLNISVADLNFQTLKFNNFHSFKECGNFIQAGRIVSYKHNGIDGLLFSTSNQIPDDTDKNLHPPQDDESIFGKILFFDLETKEYIIFSKGHRNIQGLYTEGDLILSTEHGPKGGDEINRIKFKENYGWPLASYGEKYSSYNSKTYYKKNHISQGFQEPIFAYVPSIAISEIIRLPNEFSENFQNNFIITTLAQRHIHRVKFDKNFEKLIFDEKILIDERIRDIVYIKKNNLILMAFEEKGEIGLLSKK
ncbi:PQQ-dependent sugar dehydrogenase, partial [Candidatus Pelagibacter sp.]|nr:PQQ-dependent sugar dehydrogenase [Candidatus Pelagibacter sp.]